MVNEQPNKKFLVIGLGPIGGIFACHLSAAGHEVTGIDIWKNHVEEINREGIHIEKLVTLRGRLKEAQTGLDALKDRQFDYVVISIKTPYMDALIPEIIKLKGDFVVVSLQNGIDNESFLAEFFKPERVLRIVVNYAGNMISPGKISMSFFHKPNYIGGVNREMDPGPARKLAHLLSAAALDTEQVEDIRKFTWKKAILNSVLAPISALLGMTMAEVMTCRETRSLVEQMLSEGLAVAERLGFDYGENFFQQSLDYLSGAGHHKPSMLIDIEKGNPTEIDYINGKITAYGKKFNLPVPLNATITSLIKAREQFPLK